MHTRLLLAALATLALALSVANAQGPDCKSGPHPTVLAVQQKCAKGSLLCKEAQVTDPTPPFFACSCATVAPNLLPLPPPPPPPG